MDKKARRNQIYKSLIDKGYGKKEDLDSLKKSVQELNEEQIDKEKKRLENKLISNINKLLNTVL